MVALAANTARPSRRLGKLHSYPVLTNVNIYQGSLVMITAAGWATIPAADAGNAGCVGVAVARANNTGGANGAIDVTVQEGEFLMTGDTLAQTIQGKVCYADDDNTVDETQTANFPRAGLVAEFVSASSAWVLVSLATAS
jgi:hypothetical protein